MEADKAKEKDEQKLYRAVQKLGNTEREAVVLYYFADLSQEEIAKILGLTYGNVQVILYRAKKNLKKMLNRKEMSDV
ncbi:sigma-70 family RNA polymerase sigma factor [Lachnospiraceae bacterium 62-26]